MINEKDSRAFPAQAAESFKAQTCGSTGFWYRREKHKQIKDIRRGGNPRKRR
jgi:hypothetical protein